MQLINIYLYSAVVVDQLNINWGICQGDLYGNFLKPVNVQKPSASAIFTLGIVALVSRTFKNNNYLNLN